MPHRPFMRIPTPLTTAAVAAVLVLAISACGGSDDGPPRTTTSTSAGAGASSPTAGASSPAAAVPTTAPSAAARDNGPANPDGGRALAHVQKLATDIGPRVSGTEGEQLAVRFIADELRAAGYSVEVQPFAFSGDRFRPGTVSFGGAEYEAVTMSGSAGGDVTAGTAFVGLADDAGIGGRSLTGKIAVADRGTLRFGEKYTNVRAAGAIGLVVINSDDGLFSGNIGEASAFPVVAVALEDGAALRSAAQRGDRMTVQAASPDSSTAVNVIARPRAGERCRILVGGHHDSVTGAPGANDNATGTALVIELARAFAADGLDAGLCFATFGAEESGLYGSQNLAQDWEKAGTLPAIYVNLDVTGIGDTVEIIGDEALRARALAVAGRLNIPATRSSLPANSGSDHQSFSAVGVAVLFFSSGDFSTIHTPRDVTADIELEELERVGEVAYATVKDLLASLASQGSGT